MIETTLTFDQYYKKHRSMVQQRPRDKILLDQEYKFFKLLQEPRNRYDIALGISTSYKHLGIMLDKYLKQGLIKQVDHNPNKYMTTDKGNLVLYKIKELNLLMDKYTMSLLDV